MSLYRVGRLLCGLYFRLAHRLAVQGAERIPAEGGALLCANHASYLDALLLIVASRRPVRFLIIDTFYRHPLLGWLIRQSGAIPVAQRGVDKEPLAKARELLRQGELVGIFPEGRLSRSGVTGRGMLGAAMLAASAQVPLVPASISGAYYAFRRGQRLPRPVPLAVLVHEPLPPPPPHGRDRQTLRQFTDRLMAVIRSGIRQPSRQRRR